MNESKPADESLGSNQRSFWRLGTTLALTLVGGLIGSYLLGPYGLENATPYPYVVGFGFGALPTLILLFLGRLTFSYLQK